MRDRTVFLAKNPKNQYNCYNIDEGVQNMKHSEESTYERILAAAAKLFAKEGYAGTTTRQIVAEANASLASLQLHFKSKENLYYAVVEKTTKFFYTANASILDEINETDKRGLLDKETAWNLLVQLTAKMVEWAFCDEYRYEILLIQRELQNPSEVFEQLPDSLYDMFYYYEKLLKMLVDVKNDFEIKSVCFSVVMTLFDHSNYPRVLGRVLGCDVELPENKERVKVYVKNFMLSAIRTNLDRWNK